MRLSWLKSWEMVLELEDCWFELNLSGQDSFFQKSFVVSLHC